MKTRSKAARAVEALAQAPERPEPAETPRLEAEQMEEVRGLLWEVVRCRRFARPEAERESRESEPMTVSRLSGSSADGLSSAIDRALQATRELVQQREQASHRLGEVQRHSGPERAVLVARNQRGLAGPGLVLALIERAKESRVADPKACRSWADAAVAAAERLDSRAHVSLQARAWAEKGNAERIAEDFASARTSFDRALELLEAAEGGVLSFRGDVYSLLGSFEHALRRSGEALACLEVAQDCYRLLGAAEDLRDVRINRANVATFQGSFPQAIRALLRETRELLGRDEVDDVTPLLVTCHNLLWTLAEAALSMESRSQRQLAWRTAHEALPQLRALYEGCPAPGWMPRYHWLCGRLHLAVDQLSSAEAAFDRVVAEFLDLGMHATAAVVSLDLALTLARQREHGEMRAVARAACVVLKAAGLRPDAWLALELLVECDAVAAESVILEGLKKLGGASLRRTPENRAIRQL